MRQLAACIPEIAAGPPEIYFHFLHLLLPPLHTHNIEKTTKSRFSWLNCALRGDEAVYWVSIGQQWLVLGGTESAYWRFQFVIAGKGPV